MQSLSWLAIVSDVLHRTDRCHHRRVLYSRAWCIVKCLFLTLPPFSAAVSQPSKSSTAPISLEVQVNTQTGIIQVSNCGQSSAVKGLIPLHRSAHKVLRHQYLQNLRYSRKGLLPISPEGCFGYSVELSRRLNKKQLRRYGDTWLIDYRTWLWRPDTDNDIVLNISVMPQNHTYSVPWQRSDAGLEQPLAFSDWPGKSAFGNLSPTNIVIGKQVLRVAFVNVQNARRRRELLLWLKEAANAVASVYGTFPINDVQVLVVADGAKREAVPWAEVQRGGFPAVHFYVDSYRPIEQFRQDWTAVHELSHLLLPSIHYQDRWLSEGLATYYQNVARAKAGMLTAEEAWNELRKGFAKGRRKGTTSLLESRQTKHIYWGGAAYWMLADMRLRRLENPSSLNDVLQRLQQCCLDHNKVWRASDLTAKLNELSNSTIFSDLLKNEASQTTFPLPQKLESTLTPLRGSLGEILRQKTPSL